VSNQELLLKHRVNPLLVLSDIMRGISERTHRFLDESWAVFNGYITYKFLKRDEIKARNAVLKAEELAQTFVKVVQEIPTDSMLEASALLYFILANEGISRRYEDVLVKPSLSFASRCIEDYSRGVVSLDSSPALSRCVGLSYIFVDELSERHKEALKELVGLCDRPEPPYGYFCLYAAFSSTLKAVLNREKGEPLCRRVAKVFKVLGEGGALETITLMFLTAGLSQYAGCRNEAMSLRLFQKLAEALEKDRRILIRKSRRIWLALSLALKLNRLDKLTYVPENYEVLRKDVARRIANILRLEEKKATNLIMYYSSIIIGPVSLSVGIAEVLSAAGIALPIPLSSLSLALLIVGALFTPIGILLFKRHTELQNLLVEPDIRRLLDEIARETR